MKVYLVVELYKSGDAPRVIGCFAKKKHAEDAAYAPGAHHWRNVVPLKVLDKPLTQEDVNR